MCTVDVYSTFHYPIFLVSNLHLLPVTVPCETVFFSLFFSELSLTWGKRRIQRGQDSDFWLIRILTLDNVWSGSRQKNGSKTLLFIRGPGGLNSPKKFQTSLVTVTLRSSSTFTVFYFETFKKQYSFMYGRNIDF